jgi:hypothetical protein
MSISAATLKLLMDAGVTGDALVTVVAAIEADHAKPGRSSAAERQARYRARKAAGVGDETDDNVTCDVTPSVTDVTLKERSPTPPKEKQTNHSLPSVSNAEVAKETEAARSSKRANGRGHRLPADWALSDDDREFAATVLPAQRVRSEADKFRDYWHAANGPPSVKRDWSAAWRNWCRKAAENNGRWNGQDRQRGNVIDAADRLVDFVRTFDEPAPAEDQLRLGASSSVVRAVSNWRG